MILIISEESERTTDEVVQWLLNNNVKFLRINKEDNLKILCINPSTGEALVEVNDIVYDLDTFDPVWYRRGYFNSNCIFLKSQVNKLINLKIAKECGLQIPETNISCKGFVIKLYASITA